VGFEPTNGGFAGLRQGFLRPFAVVPVYANKGFHLACLPGESRTFAALVSPKQQTNGPNRYLVHILYALLRGGKSC
jgi:hypothetical protein